MAPPESPLAAGYSMTLAAPEAWFQPAINPPSPLKINSAGLPLTLKSWVALNTIPVGSTVVPPPLGGKVTTNGSALPVPSYSVDVLLWLLATQKGVGGPATMPHGLTRL